jgi:hypothetical protein
MTVPMIIGGFGLGICAGSIVLSRIHATDQWERAGGGALHASTT